MSNPLFAMVPTEVLADGRLTLWQLKVLVGLLSFRSKNSDTVWPGRDALAERCGGMHVSNISKTTSELCELGWLEKHGNGGNSRSLRYRIVVPNLDEIEKNGGRTNVVDSATSPIVAESTTQTGARVAESTTLSVAESARGIEQTIEHTNKSNRQGARELLARRGVPDELAGAWIVVRRAKRLAITEPALDLIQREATKAGMSFVDVIKCCCENGWAGFKAHWPRESGERTQQKQSAQAWWMSEQATLAKGNEIGITARPGESMQEFKGRIRLKIAESTGQEPRT